MTRQVFIGLIICMLSTSVVCLAKSGLEFVQIVEGISQTRPQTSRKIIGRRYVWNFKSIPYTILMAINVEDYNIYASKERLDIAKMVAEGIRSLDRLTQEVQRIIKTHRSWSQEDQGDFILSFVQSLPYTHDDVTTGFDEFRRYAIETLLEGGGDCEDTTILTASILEGLGMSTALIFSPGHIAIGINGDYSGSAIEHNGVKYFYGETTGTGWRIGQVPDSVGQKVTVQPLNNAPLTPRRPRSLTPEPVIQPQPTAPQPDKPKPESVTLQSTSPPDHKSPSVHAGHIIALFIVLIGIGSPIVYLLFRFLFPDLPDETEFAKSEFDDNSESADSIIDS